MPSSTDKKILADKSKKTQSGDKKPTPVAKPLKEQEGVESVDLATGIIEERDKEADKHVEKEIQAAAGEEARLKEPEVELPPDVADAGVVSPQKAASETLGGEATINLPITKEEFEKGERTQVSAKVTQKKEVFGVSSLVALALLVGRLIKLAHHHAKKVIFRNQKESE